METETIIFMALGLLAGIFFGSITTLILVPSDSNCTGNNQTESCPDVYYNLSCNTTYSCPQPIITLDFNESCLDYTIFYNITETNQTSANVTNISRQFSVNVNEGMGVVANG